MDQRRRDQDKAAQHPDSREPHQRQLSGEQHWDADDQQHPPDDDPPVALALLDLGDLRTQGLERRDARSLARRYHGAENGHARHQARSPRSTSRQSTGD